jgi:hypothetical protein
MQHYSGRKHELLMASLTAEKGSVLHLSAFTNFTINHYYAMQQYSGRKRELLMASLTAKKERKAAKTAKAAARRAKLADDVAAARRHEVRFNHAYRFCQSLPALHLLPNTHSLFVLSCRCFLSFPCYPYQASLKASKTAAVDASFCAYRFYQSRTCLS